MIDLECNHITHFDVVGDIHGCYYELMQLLQELGYEVDPATMLVSHPERRTLVLIGDITDRGFYNSLCLQFAVHNRAMGNLLWVQGNHDHNLFAWLQGCPVRLAHGLQGTVQELEQAWPFTLSKEHMGADLLENIPTRISLDGGAVVAAHAYNGRAAKQRLYGPRGGPDNERIPWWETYEEDPFVIYGHYWAEQAVIREHSCCVDTSCVAGGALSALRWPERDIKSVPAFQTYFRD